MKWRETVVLVLTFIVAMTASAQSATQDRWSEQETQIRGNWVDPSTGLMWAGKDNGKDVSWRKAVKYCRNLRLDGYSDWRLANNVELQSIYDKTANAPGLAGPPKKVRAFTWHVKGNVFLTGDQWANNWGKDDRGHSSGDGWYFDFNEGLWDHQPIGFPYGFDGMRALCVRGSRK